MYTSFIKLYIQIRTIVIVVAIRCSGGAGGGRRGTIGCSVGVITLSHSAVHGLYWTGHEEAGGEIDWKWEYDGRIVLSRNPRESLKVAQLQSHWLVIQHQACLSQCMGGLTLTLGLNDLKSSIAGL